MFNIRTTHGALIADRKEATPIKDPVVFYGEGRGLALTPKDFYSQSRYDVSFQGDIFLKFHWLLP
jgi:hypothetical protein